MDGIHGSCVILR